MTGVKLTGVNKNYGKLVAVRNLDLEVNQGEFLSLVGPSGCGKSTTLRMVAGFINPDKGEVSIGNRSMKRVHVRDRKVGMVFQNYALFPNLSIWENVAFGLRVRKESEKVIKDKVDHMLSIVGLLNRSDYYPKQLSGGQQQRVALARALAIAPEVLLLDEPLSALDAKVRNSLRFEIKKIQREYKITTIYVTHDQEEALSISDRVALMNEGTVEQIGTPWDIYTKPSSLFVADFVGVNNLLQVTSTGDMVNWNGHRFKVNGSADFPDGDCVLAIRPEKLSASNGDGENVIRGVISGKVFLGPLMRVAVDVEGTQILVDMLSSESRDLATGSNMVICFDPSAGYLVAR